MDNTLLMVFSDNGASAEGGKDGTLNEHRFTSHIRESLEENLARSTTGAGSHLQPLLVGLGLGRQHPAAALEALHLAGGTRAPLIVHWRGRVTEPGRCDRSSPTPST